MSKLQAACADPERLLSSLPEEDFLRLVYECFSHDIDSLRRAYSIRGKPLSELHKLSPSQILYGEQQQYDEVNRTLVGLLSLRWIHGGQYEAFAGISSSSSSPAEQDQWLSLESFKWIRDFYSRTIITSNDLFTLITSIIVNDLGKDPGLAAEYHSRTQEDISRLNHDAILFKAIQIDLIPSISRLPTKEDINDVIRAMQLGATFNFGQLAQAENAPISLSSLLIMKDEERSFNLRFMEQILDIAGAAGHINWTCAKQLTQPIFEAYRSVYDACIGVINGHLSFRQGYDLVLYRRAERLHARGFRVLDIDRNPEDRALTRLLCMGGVADLETAELYETIWGNELDASTKSSLVHTLNMHGSIAQPVVQPTYMPALLGRATSSNSSKSSSVAEKRRRSELLTHALRYLARVMIPKDGEISSPSSVMLVERSVLGVLKKYVENGEFFENPGILDRIDVPEGVPATL